MNEPDVDDAYQVAPTNAAQAARLRFIDFLLDQFGMVAPRHLIDYFGLAQAQATRDLRSYRDTVPAAHVVYDTAGKCYRATSAFVRHFP